MMVGKYGRSNLNQGVGLQLGDRHNLQGEGHVTGEVSWACTTGDSWRGEERGNMTKTEQNIKM